MNKWIDEEGKEIPPPSVSDLRKGYVCEGCINGDHDINCMSCVVDYLTKMIENYAVHHIDCGVVDSMIETARLEDDGTATAEWGNGDCTCGLFKLLGDDSENND